MIADVAAALGLRSAALRYFNAAGADPGGQIGELHDPESHLIPLAMQAVTADGPPLTLFGDDYPTADGTCIRDYIHVADLADAHVRALEQLDSRTGADAFNLGTGRGASVRQVLDAVAKVAGKPVPHSIGPRRVGDPAELVSDPAKAMRELGWSFMPDARMYDSDAVQLDLPVLIYQGQRDQVVLQRVADAQLRHRSAGMRGDGREPAVVEDASGGER